MNTDKKEVQGLRHGDSNAKFKVREMRKNQQDERPNKSRREDRRTTKREGGVPEAS